MSLLRAVGHIQTGPDNSQVHGPGDRAVGTWPAWPRRTCRSTLSATGVLPDTGQPGPTALAQADQLSQSLLLDQT
jgi:hypothetical protein